jgi:hypothetical protein
LQMTLLHAMVAVHLLGEDTSWPSSSGLTEHQEDK